MSPDLAHQLAALKRQTVAALRQRYAESLQRTNPRQQPRLAPSQPLLFPFPTTRRRQCSRHAGLDFGAGLR
jgi:hypothetical protein